MPNADSKKRNIKHTKQVIPVIGLYEFTIIRKIYITDAKTIPIIHANFFCFAPTYSGTWLRTIKRPIINEGEYLGLMNTRISRSVRKKVIKYLAGTKLLFDKMSISEIKVPINSIPAEALISLSLRTGIE